MKNKLDVPALRVCVRLIAGVFCYSSSDSSNKTTILVVISSLQIHCWVGPCLVPFKRVLGSVKALERARSAQR